MTKKAVITTMNSKDLGFLYEDDRLVGIDVIENDKDKLGLLEIYTAKVKNIVENINAAFLDINGETAFYSLEKNRADNFINHKKDSVIKVGDELLVQVEREAIKSKNASCTGFLNIHGENMILTFKKPGIGVSKKNTKEDRERLKKVFNEDRYEDIKTELGDFGFILRTNAKDMSDEELLSEADALVDKLKSIFKKAESSYPGKLIYRSFDNAQDLLNRIGKSKDAYIVTDVKRIYDDLLQANEGRKEKTDIRFYDKDTPLAALYDLKKALSDSLKKRTWLKSGGSVVMEPTEALVAIDVNTGKSILDKKNKEGHFLNINKEAATVIANALRVRNYTGIIIIDFIDLEKQESRDELMAYLKNELKKDSVKTTLVDMTPLGLVEVTRHKLKKPLHEYFINKAEEDSDDTEE